MKSVYIFYRNFLGLFRRFKVAVTLNVLGLSVAFAAFMVIMMQVDYDLRFDSCQPEADNIFRMSYNNDDEENAVVFSRPFSREAFASSPHIKAGAIMNPWVFDSPYYIEGDLLRNSYRDPSWGATAELLDVFDFDMVEGGKDALSTPDALIMPQSMARRLFGEESALGKRLINTDDGKLRGVVCGVFKDFPRNSSMRNIMYHRLSDEDNYNAWNNWNYLCFMRLDDASNMPAVVDLLNDKFVADKRYFNNEVSSLSLWSLSGLHFNDGFLFDNMPKANRGTIYVLIAIAVIILLIAAINFTNFSTALTPMRIKSINTRKVLGSSDRALRTGLLVEAVVICFLAWLMALGMIWLASTGAVSSIVDADMSVVVQWPIVVGTALIAIVVGVLAGIYPACYITSFAPALVLKGTFALSPKGLRLRNCLVGVQFVASFALIIAAVFMSLQNRYMTNLPMGYDKDQLIVIELNEHLNDNPDMLESELCAFAGIDRVTWAEQILSSQDSYMRWGRELNGKTVRYEVIPVSPSFLDVLGIKVTDGRGFRPDDDLKGNGSYVFNEAARRAYGFKVGDKIDNNEIIGFMPDVKFGSCRSLVSPMCFIVWGKYKWGMDNDRYYRAAYVRVKAGSNLYAAMDHVTATLGKLDPYYPFSVRFYDDVIQSLYESERRVGRLITLFSAIAVLISIVGVFGLVVFESAYKRREVALRKVLGSSTAQILLMFNKGYIVILSVCFVLAILPAYYGIDSWLANFAYRTPMHWWVFAIVFVAVSALTLITVTLQNFHVANSNPVNSLKAE